jgi:thioredoxin-like negative regulator of GroEL
MNPRFFARILTLAAALALATAAGADELRNIKTGAPLPSYKLPTVAGAVLDSDALKESVVVLVYLSAEQRSSELAAADSAAVVHELTGQPVKLIHVTADVVGKPYFDRFRSEHQIDAPLAFDADRTLYHQLGLIVFPTTVVADKKGNLAHVISLRGPDYAKVLDAYIRHTLGQLTDSQLADKLKATASTEASPKSRAAAHRAAARHLREKGRLDSAKEELLRAREQEPGDHEVLLDLADIDLATNTLDEADRYLADVLAAQPDHRRAKQLKGIALFKRGKLEEAEKILLEALALNPDPARVHYYLGRIYEGKNDSAKAIQHYREALQKLLSEDLPAATSAAPAPAPTAPTPPTAGAGSK